MKKIFILLCLTQLAVAGELVLAKVYIDSFTLTELKAMRTKLINYTKNHGQPANRFSAIVNVSTNTHPLGLLRSTYRENNLIIDETSKEILIKLDAKVLSLDYVQSAINDGKIDILVVYRYNRNGYIRDANFYTMQAERRAFIDKWKYIVEVSSE